MSKNGIPAAVQCKQGRNQRQQEEACRCCYVRGIKKKSLRARWATFLLSGKPIELLICASRQQCLFASAQHCAGLVNLAASLRFEIMRYRCLSSSHPHLRSTLFVFCILVINQQSVQMPKMRSSKGHNSLNIHIRRWSLYTRTKRNG